MGFKVTFKDITMPQFNQTMAKIYRNQEFKDVKVAYKLKRLVEKLEVHQKSFYQLYADIQKLYVIDVPVVEEGKEDRMEKQIDPERQQEFTDKINELGTTELDIDWHQMTLDDFEGMKVTASDITMLEPILDASSLSDLQVSVQS